MSTEINVAAEEKVIAQVIHNSIGWALNKDKDLMYAGMAKDSSLFIYHPDKGSTIRGFDAFREMTESFFMHEAFKATSYDIRDLNITLSQSGSVAWWSAILDDRGEVNGKPYAWVNTRWTGVLEKREGNWVICQMHLSFASDADKDETGDQPNDDD